MFFPLATSMAEPLFLPYRNWLHARKSLPAIEITVGTTEGDQTLLVGSSTADGKGVYCARLGKDGVFVTSAEAVQVLSQDLSAYRQEKNASQP